MMMSTRLALLLAAHLDGAGPAPLEPASLDKMLAWCRKTGTGEDGLPLGLELAPGETARLSALLARGALLDRTIEGWARAGIWVVGRDEPEYPKRMKRRLKSASPALLFGSGDKSVLNRGGVALVAGAAISPFVIDRLREALDEEDLTAIVLDETMRAGSGETIAVRRDGSVTAQPGGQSVLVGLVEPGRIGDETLGAERLLYALADAALLVGVERADPAWAGAVSVIEHGVLPVWVRGEETDAGMLIRAGARMLPPGPIVPRDLLRPEQSVQGRRATSATSPAAGMSGPSMASGFAEAQAGFDHAPRPPVRGAHLRLIDTSTAAVERSVPAAVGRDPEVPGQTLFALFSARLSILLSHGPLGAGRIADVMGLTRLQTEAWLTQVEASGAVKRDPETATYATVGAADG